MVLSRVLSNVNLVVLCTFHVAPVKNPPMQRLAASAVRWQQSCSSISPSSLDSLCFVALVCKTLAPLSHYGGAFGETRSCVLVKLAVSAA